MSDKCDWIKLKYTETSFFILLNYIYSLKSTFNINTSFHVRHWCQSCGWILLLIVLTLTITPHLPHPTTPPTPTPAGRKSQWERFMLCCECKSEWNENWIQKASIFGMWLPASVSQLIFDLSLTSRTWLSPGRPRKHLGATRPSFLMMPNSQVLTKSKVSSHYLIRWVAYWKLFPVHLWFSGWRLARFLL